jgi:amidohydrolase
LKKIKVKICQDVDLIADELFLISGKIYETPEIAYREYQACEWLSQFLEDKGFVVQKRAGNLETAFFAELPHVSKKRPTVAFIAEYDALPKIGHGCGHNLICMASLGAGIVMKKYLKDIDGRFVIIGTPGEEGGGGKVKLYEAGVFGEVNVAMMFHPNHRTVTGEDLLGRIKFIIEFFGKTSHASSAPHMGANALDGIILTFNNINALRQQIREDTKIHGIITHGGDAPNIIPDYAAGLFYVRAKEMDYMKNLFEKVQNCAHAAALASGTAVKVKTEYPILEPMKRNKILENVCRRNMVRLDLNIDSDESQGGSSDIGNLSWKLPAIQPCISICDKNIQLHSVDFAKATRSPKARETLINATKILALTALDYLSSTKIQDQVTEEFNECDNQYLNFSRDRR